MQLSNLNKKKKKLTFFALIFHTLSEFNFVQEEEKNENSIV